MEQRQSFPEVEALSKLSSQIAASVEAYKSAQSTQDKTDALEDLAHASQRLTTTAKDPRDAFTDFTFQPVGNACVRIALSMGLFDQLSESKARSSAELAELTNSDPTLAARVLRALASLSIIKVDDDGNYLHGPFSLMYVDKSRKAYSLWMWDGIARASTAIGPYFDEGDKKTPTDSAKSPFSFAYGKLGTQVFDVLNEIGKFQLFVDAMSGSSVLCAKEAVATYAFDQLETSDGGTVIVDVGGNNGQTLLEIKQAYPKLKGQMVLQDLQSVLDTGTVPGLEVELQAHDFFKEVQPVKGASAYFYQRIFHDWGDKECHTILKNLRPAMGSHSKLLICDVVIPNASPPARKVLRDINMLLIAGMERSESQWKELLESEGFSIAKIHGLQNTNNSIIEATIQPS